MSLLNRQVVSGKVGFHIIERAHNMLLEDWNRYMDFADIVLNVFVLYDLRTIVEQV